MRGQGHRISARLAVAALVAGFAAAGLPASAPAHEVQLVNRCYLALRNKTNVTLRTEEWSPNLLNISVPWAPTWAIEHAISPGRDDIPPGRLGRLFSAVGSLFQGGCGMKLVWSTPLGSVVCEVSSTSFEKNQIGCREPYYYIRENFKLEIQDRVDKPGEMGGTAVVTRIGAVAGSRRSSTRPRTAAHASAGVASAGAMTRPSPLRAGDLPGRGWRAARAIEMRRLMGSLEQVKLPRGCVRRSRSRTPYQPSGSAGWLFMRKNKGEEMVIGSAFAFARPGEARMAQAQSLSLKGARCLAGGIGGLKGIDASASPLRFGAVGARSSAYGIAIRETSPGKGRAQLDLVLLYAGRSLAVIGFYSEEHRMAIGVERSVAKTVARRLARG